MNKKWKHMSYPDIAPGKKDYQELITGLVGAISGS